MKKLVCLSLVIMLIIASSAFADETMLTDEILFRGIPWGSNIPTAHEVLVGIPMKKSSLLESMVSWKSSNLLGTDNSVESESRGSVKVAGYDAKITLTFLFSHDDDAVYTDDERAQLFSAHYLINPVSSKTVYADLYEKLSKIYGEGESADITYGQETVWYGANDTGICLRRVSEYVYIYYGRTDDTLISNLKTAMIREEQEKAENDSTGL